MHVFKHPKFYEEYRKRARAYQKELKASQEKKAISPKPSTDGGGRAPKKIATSYKQQATSGPRSDKRQATSDKPQASLEERQATSVVCGSSHRAPSKAFRDGR